jgi:adenosylhomocysteine nucleosidase
MSDVSRQLRIGIVAALPAELAPLVRGWGIEGRVYNGRLAGQDGGSATLYASAAGMGAAAATRSFADVLAAGGGLDAVVSYGWAGALSCGVKPPNVFAASEVIDSRTGERFAAVGLPADAPLRLVTLDHVARGDEKRPLAKRYHAVLVDMEAATVARLARAHGIPFLCLKAISDAFKDVLPDFNLFLDRDGQLRVPAFAVHSALRPRYWPALTRLGANSKRAAHNLAAQLPACLQSAGLLSCQT